jgi:WD40 repeat protein
LLQIAEDVPPVNSVPAGLIPRARRRAIVAPALAGVTTIAIVAAAAIGVAAVLRARPRIPATQGPVPTAAPEHPTRVGDGTLVFATTHGAFAATADGVRRLRTPPDFDGCCGIAISPDGTQLAYGVAGVPPDAGGLVQVSDVRTAQILASTGRVGGAAHDVAWSPDGTAFAFSHGDALGTYSLHGERATSVTEPPPNCRDELPTWSAASGEIAFFRVCGDDAAAIEVVRSDGSAETRLISMTVRPVGLAWSPDGSRLALASDDGSVWVVERGGSDLRRISAPADGAIGGSGTIAWSPDGTTIASVRDGGIDVIEVSSGTIRPLSGANGMGPVSLSWSSAG